MELANCLIDLRSGPASVRLREELRGRVRAARSLPANDREVLVLRYLEQLQHNDIAAVLGLTDGVVPRCGSGPWNGLRDLLHNEFGRSEP